MGGNWPGCRRSQWANSDEQSWSVEKVSLKVGDDHVEYYSIIALAKCMDGDIHRIVFGRIQFKIDIKVGEVTPSEGFKIEARKPVKAGDSFPAVLVGDS